MRIAVATVNHETNTFSDGVTELDGFAFETGRAVFDSFTSGRSLDGIVETFRSAPESVSVIPLVGAASIPGPTVSSDAFETIDGELRKRLAGEDIDGVCLDLHGSMYVEGEPDAEGALVETIREAVGEEVPVTAALDMHATITERMVEGLDGVTGYRTAPHTDVVETGHRAAGLLLDTLRGEADLTLGWRRLPMLLAGERSETEAEPMRTLVGRLESADERAGVLDANYFLGFPWADSPRAGCHALVTGDAGATESVEEVTTDLATAFWERRREFDFTTEANRPEAALDEAAAESERPVVIADTGDIPGAGASEDVTNLLSLILDRDDLGTPAVAIFADPDSLAACERAGVDAAVDLELGRSVPEGDPLALAGVVQAIHRGDGTTAARVAVDGADVVLADERTNLHRDPPFFEEIGIDTAEREVVVLKSGYLSPDWKAVAARRLFALTPGDTNQLLEDLPYEEVPRPIYPVDEDTEWSP